MPTIVSAKIQRANRRSFFLPFAASLVLIFSMGCAHSSGASAEHSNSVLGALSLEISLEESSYRPGDPILATVLLTNHGDRALTLRPLSAYSLAFYAGDEDTENRAIVKPVASSKERPAATLTLEAGAQLERTFLFTRLTESDGHFVTTARYGSSVGREVPEAVMDEVIHVFAAPTRYAVEGERAFNRDSGGFLAKEDALRLCRAEAEDHTANFDAVLIRNEAGFVDWWVFEEENTLAEADLGTGDRAWIVNPYLGVIRSVAELPPLSMRKGDTNYRISNRRAGEDPTLRLK